MQISTFTDNAPRDTSANKSANKSGTPSAKNRSRNISPELMKELVKPPPKNFSGKVPSTLTPKKENSRQAGKPLDVRDFNRNVVNENIEMPTSAPTVEELLNTIATPNPKTPEERGNSPDRNAF